MKRSILSAWLLALCWSLICSTSAAAPALVNTDSVCAVGWLSADPLPPAALPNIVLIYSSGVALVTNNDNGIYQSHCNAKLDWSQPVAALNFFTGEPVVVQLAGFGETCAILGFCPNGRNGSVIMDASSGFVCMTPFGPTAEWRAVVTPSGNVSMTCKLPERPVSQ